MKKILTIVFLFVAIGMGFAQAPPNDEAVTATVIPFPLPYQSTGLAFTNVNATPSTAPLIIPAVPVKTVTASRWISNFRNTCKHSRTLSSLPARKTLRQRALKRPV